VTLGECPTRPVLAKTQAYQGASIALVMAADLD
jgi:hypothetical protein